MIVIIVCKTTFLTQQHLIKYSNGQYFTDITLISVRL